MSFSENYRRFHNALIEKSGFAPNEWAALLFVFLFVLSIPLIAFFIEYRTYSNAEIISSSPYAKTVVHDKHWYIILTHGRYGGPVHHPDCPCGWGRSAERLSEAYKTFEMSPNGNP